MESQLRNDLYQTTCREVCEAFSLLVIGEGGPGSLLGGATPGQAAGGPGLYRKAG